MTNEQITSRPLTVEVGDMGHSYDVTSDIPGVVVYVRGVCTWLPIDAKGIEVRRSDVFDG